MKQLISIVIFFVVTCGTSWAQLNRPTYIKPDKAYRYRVYFTDKKHNTYSVKRPEAFLSEKALERREKYKIKVDEHDLPVTPIYLEYLNKNKYKVVSVSKWNNTAVVEVADSTSIGKLSTVSFVEKTLKVWESPDSLQVAPKADRLLDIENRCDTLDSFYGRAEGQNLMLNVDKLHEKGYRGKGMTIAVIDGGFYNADHIQSLKECSVLGTHNFVNPSISVFDEPQQHGTMVLSCIAANLSHRLVGTAPEASFYLLISENNESESIAEEDYWCAAVEYADSVGVDVVTSSLGYHKFDDASTTHKYYELDGETAINSRSASLAASRGLLLVNSAGNEGDSNWKKIGCPADAKDIFTVGAVNKNRINTLFSSLGNTADGRIKPDIMAQGEKSWLLDCHGNVTHANGTSFSAPIFCGAVTCLLQAFPKTKPTEIIKAVQTAGDNAQHPDNVFGYGIPDLLKAYEILKQE